MLVPFTIGSINKETFVAFFYASNSFVSIVFFKISGIESTRFRENTAGCDLPPTENALFIRLVRWRIYWFFRLQLKIFIYKTHKLQNIHIVYEFKKAALRTNKTINQNEILKKIYIASSLFFNQLRKNQTTNKYIKYFNSSFRHYLIQMLLKYFKQVTSL